MDSFLSFILRLYFAASRLRVRYSPYQAHPPRQHLLHQGLRLLTSDFQFYVWYRWLKSYFQSDKNTYRLLWVCGRISYRFT